MATRGHEDRIPLNTHYIELEGRPHLAMVGEGWEDAAASIERWLTGVLAAEPTRTAGASAEPTERR